MDIRYKNDVMREMIGRKYGTRTFAWVANTIYNGTPSTSPARRLVADMFAYAAGNDEAGDWDFVIERINKQVLVDALKTTVQVREAPQRPPGPEHPNRYMEKEEIVPKVKNVFEFGGSSG